MMHARRDARLTLGTSATYRIRVQGRLDESWSERLVRFIISDFCRFCRKEIHASNPS
jgi:hypothetical protein